MVDERTVEVTRVLFVVQRRNKLRLLTKQPVPVDRHKKRVIFDLKLREGKHIRVRLTTRSNLKK